MSFFFSSPASLPNSRACIAGSLVAYTVVGLIFLGDQRGLLSIVAQITIEVVILAVISVIILKYINKPERLLQTLSALIGVSLILSVVSLLIMSLLPDAAGDEQVHPVVLQVNLILLLWNLAVISLIFKRAFEIKTIAAGFIAFNYFLLYELLLINFF